MTYREKLRVINVLQMLLVYGNPAVKEQKKKVGGPGWGGEIEREVCVRERKEKGGKGGEGERKGAGKKKALPAVFS